jgi:hypothetical protein
MKLAAARTLAWALWLGGWLVLGDLGRHSGPLQLGGMLPLALWLGGIGLLLHGFASARVPVGALVAALIGAAAISLVGLLAAMPLLAALGWAALVVAASRVVRALRRAAPGVHASPVGPACAGAVLAWAVSALLPMWGQSPGLAALGPAAAALGLASLLPRGAAASGGCRAGLFDCALPAAELTRWSLPADWPLQAAMLAMLPMMAGLPVMAEACSALGWPATLATAAHLAAMLLPGALLLPWLRRARLSQRRQGVALLLGLGGLSMWVWPGALGLMAAALAHGAAWSLAWAGSLAQPAGRSAEAAPHFRFGLLASAIGLATAAALLGLAIDRNGSAALVAVHEAIAFLGVAGGLAQGLRSPARSPAA